VSINGYITSVYVSPQRLARSDAAGAEINRALGFPSGPPVESGREFIVETGGEFGRNHPYRNAKMELDVTLPLA